MACDLCDWWISIRSLCFCVSRFVVCDHNYDWRQQKTQLWRQLLNFRVRMFVKSAVKKRNIQKIPQLIPFLSTAHRSSARNVKNGSVNAFTGLKFVRSTQGGSRLWPDNVSFKLIISQNRKWADKNSSKLFLWIKNCVKLLIDVLK